MRFSISSLIPRRLVRSWRVVHNVRPESDTRVLLISQWYAPEPVSVPVETAKQLRRAGLKVEVLTGIPNLPNGQVYPPYTAWKSFSESIDGIPVVRAPLYPNHSRSAVKRMLNYLSWSLSASIFGWRALRDSDVNLVHCTPATAAIPALAARWIYKTPYIVIIQDLWPDTVSASGFVRSSWANVQISRLLGKVVAVLYGNAEMIIAISDGMENELASRGFGSSNLVRLYNSVDEAVFLDGEIHEDVRSNYGIKDDSFLIVYAGNQGSAQDLEPLLRAVASLSKRNVELLLVGWGVERENLERVAAESSAKNIHFVGRVSPTEVQAIQSQSNLCVVSLKNDPLFDITVPSKLQTLLASGRAILGIVAGDARDIIEEAGAGFIANPSDEASIRSAILDALSYPAESVSLMGEAGKSYYLSQMSAERRSQVLKRLVEEIVSTRSSSGSTE